MRSYFITCTARKSSSVLTRKWARKKATSMSIASLKKKASMLESYAKVSLCRSYKEVYIIAMSLCIPSHSLSMSFMLILIWIIPFLWLVIFNIFFRKEQEEEVAVVEDKDFGKKKKGKGHSPPLPPPIGQLLEYKSGHTPSVTIRHRSCS